MPDGEIILSTFQWTLLGLKDSCRNGASFISPDCHLPDSSWRLKVEIDYEMRIYLFRIDSGPPKVFKCTVKTNFHSKVATVTGDFRQKGVKPEPVLVCAYFVQQDLDIICYIENSTTHQGANSISRKFTTSAVQTEEVIEKENPKDWSSLDKKDDTLLRGRMKELLTKGIKHDVTICVQDKEFRAHQSILSARSPVFAMMLTHNSEENETGKIKIEDCDPESFDEFLLYVYSGRTGNLTPTNALRLYYPADKYDFPVLKERCVKILKTSLSVESICDVVLLAAKHQEKELLEVATEFFARNMKKILVTVNWQKFMIQNPVEANELLIKSVNIINPEN